jgi:hypothetical protein
MMYKQNSSINKGTENIKRSQTSETKNSRAQIEAQSK